MTPPLVARPGVDGVKIPSQLPTNTVPSFTVGPDAIWPISRPPDKITGRGVQPVEVAIETADQHDAGEECRRGGNVVPGPESPDHVAVRVESEDVVRQAADVANAVDHGW